MWLDKEMVPDIGFELMTYRLQGGCSTTELIRHRVHCKNTALLYKQLGAIFNKK